MCFFFFFLIYIRYYDKIDMGYKLFLKGKSDGSFSISYNTGL